MSRFMALTGTVALFSTLTFAWSISGVVQSDKGEPLSDVKISSLQPLLKAENSVSPMNRRQTMAFRPSRPPSHSKTM